MSYYRKLLNCLEVRDASPSESGSPGLLRSFFKALGEDAITALSGGTMSLSDFSWLKKLFTFDNVKELAKKYKLTEDQVRKELDEYKRRGYAPSWVVKDLSKLLSDRYFASGGRKDYSADGSVDAAESVFSSIDKKGLQTFFGKTPDSRDTNLQRLIEQLQEDGVPAEAGRVMVGMATAADKSKAAGGAKSGASSGDKSGGSKLEENDILRAQSPLDMAAWTHSSLSLKPIGYGRTNLMRGTYLLSSAGVTVQSLEDYTFKLPISAVLNWKAFTKWVSENWDAEDMEAWSAARKKAIDESATSRLQGVDFMTLLQRNPVSGDVEIDLGYLPRGNYKNLFILNVGSNAAFTLSVWADSMRLVSVVRGH